MDAHAPHDVLVLERDAGGTVTVREPVPDTAVVTLGALLAATTREWVTIEREYVVHLCGHRFIATAWAVQTPPGVLLEHVCPCSFGAIGS